MADYRPTVLTVIMGPSFGPEAPAPRPRAEHKLDLIGFRIDRHLQLERLVSAVLQSTADPGTMGPRATLPVNEISLSQHVCCALEHPAAREELAIDFVRAGVQERARVLYVTHKSTPDAVLGMLDTAGIPVGDLLARAQLLVTGVGESGLLDQRFDPDRTLATAASFIDDALAAGFDGLYATRETPWVSAAGGADAGALEDYERRVGELYRARPAAGLCQYERSSFPASLLESIANLHTHVARTAAVCPEGLLRVVPLGRGGSGEARLRLAGELDLSNTELAAEALLAGAGEHDCLHLDLARLRFIDAAGFRMLEEVALEVRSRGQRLAVHWPSRQVTRIMELLGAESTAFGQSIAGTQNDESANPRAMEG